MFQLFAILVVIASGYYVLTYDNDYDPTKNTRGYYVESKHQMCDGDYIINRVGIGSRSSVFHDHTYLYAYDENGNLIPCSTEE